MMGPADVQREPRIPPYRLIAAEIERRILSGQYQPGSLIPSEAQLAVEFHVSRMTLRHALAGLAAAGSIERRHGHGTLVAETRFARDAQNRFGLSDELAARGFAPGSHVVAIAEVLPVEEVRVALRLGPRGKVTRVLRQRYAGEVLIGYQESAIPTKLCPRLRSLDLEGVSLMQTIADRYGLRFVRATLVIDVDAAGRDLARLLEVDLGTPLLRVTRTSYLPDGRPLERTTTWYLGNRVFFRVDQSPAVAELVQSST